MYRYCHTCSARQHAEPIRLWEAILRKHGKGSFNFAELIKAYKDARSTHGSLTLEQLIEACMDDETKKRLQELYKQLTARLRKITPLNWNRASSGRGRPKQSTVRIVKGDLRPLFGLCPVCKLLIYGAEESRPGPRNLFHTECWEVFRDSKEYRRWRGQRARGSEVAFPMPVVTRGRGRPKDDPDTLLERYQDLMRAVAPRSMGGRSRHQLAEDRRKGRRTIAEGIAVLIELLPGSWSAVFLGRRHRRANETRQKLFHLPAHHGDRSPLVLELSSRGMPEEAVARLVGLPLPIVQAVLRSAA